MLSVNGIVSHFKHVSYCKCPWTDKNYSVGYLVAQIEIQIYI